MKLPLRWLKEYVDFNVTVDEFVELMMWRGFEMASVDPELPGVENVVVGRVESIKPHEQSDHLNICSVNTGSELLTIVTGAQNVHAGDLVPVALVGAKIDGHPIEPVNMRGVMSYGMLCSGKELGLTDADYPGSEVYGILILQEDHPLGQNIAAAVGLDSVVFDIELTPNRPDCASIIGICREAAAALGQTFHEPTIREIPGSGNEADYASVTVLNSELCSRYTARVVTDIKIEPSPAWMQKRLRSVGMRPINNIVDITNYVLVEYGHPMHSFDLNCISDGHIIVRNAYENEKVTTLDSKECAVTPDMLLIADPTKGVGIAGVMGGENSEITENTKVVLFEAACFKSSNIRKTARALHHVTDAAARFIKGVEPVNAMLALNRAVELVDELGAGRVIGKTIDVCAADVSEKSTLVDTDHINRMLGLSLSVPEMCSMLSTINISAEPSGDGMLVHIPHFRTDIEQGIEADSDIAEEIARIYGYDKIESTLMRGDTFVGKVDGTFAFEDKVKDTMASLGAYEMYNYNFTGPKRLDALRLDADDVKRKAVRILNPFGEDQSLMRTTLYIGMLESAQRNMNRKTGYGRFFEVGNIHLDLGGELPEEHLKLGILFFGADENFYTMKGAVEEVLSRAGVKERVYARSAASYLQPGRAAVIKTVDGTVLGELGQIHPETLSAFDIKTPVYAAELDMGAMYASLSGPIKFKALPRFETVPRDVAVVADRKTEAQTLVNAILNADTTVLVENVKLFDTYEGPGMLPGRKSFAFTFTLRAEDHTLDGDEIRGAMDAVISSLEKAGARLRA